MGHMCVQRADMTFDWSARYADARRRNARLPAHGAAAAAWQRQLDRLLAAGVAPCAPEKVTMDTAAGRMEATLAGRTSERSVTVVEGAVDKMLQDMELPEVRQRRQPAYWRNQLLRCFAGVVPEEAPRTLTYLDYADGSWEMVGGGGGEGGRAEVGRREWVAGGRCRDKEAVGARVVMVMDRERTEEVSGGQLRWMRRRQWAYVPREGDEAGLMVGEDGWVAGHEEAAAELQETFTFDHAGHAVKADGARLTVGGCQGGGVRHRPKGREGF